jgi:UDP-N-acetylmuramoylalanine--D-glutamate ligase
VFVSDFGKIKSPFKKELEDASIEFEEGGHSERRILASNLVIKSPGIPEKAGIVQSIRAEKIPIISEIEWACHFTDGKIIAITGSNGKTTTTSMIWHIINKAGWDVALAGNIGKSLARTVCEKDYEYYVVEVSSFQLDDIDTFHPHISVITNITEDHLDRYDYQFENYIQSKLSVTRNQNEDDYCIYCLDDEVTKNYIQQVGNTACIPFSWEQTVSEGAYKEGDQIIIQLKKNDLPCQ